MTVLNITPQKGHLLKISLSFDKTVFIDRDVAAQEGIKEADEIDQTRLDEIYEKSEYVRAKNRGLWFLDRAQRSERVLFEKITDGGISKEAAAKAVARFKELGLVDDRKFAESAAQNLALQNRSKREIFAKLLKKKIPPDIIKEVLDRLETDEVASVRAVIEKKYKNRLSTKEQTEKTVAALLRKGFSYGAVKTALKEYNFELTVED